jgi:ATP-dependent Clp protease ATP-binding subunit ClpA
MHDSFIAQDHLLLALLQESSIQTIIKEAGLSVDKIKKAVEDMRNGRKIDSRTAESTFDALKKYAVDLTALAEEGALDPVVGRDNEIRRVVRILCRRTKNNPVLIGEPGVGKTAIVEGLAQRIVKRDVPASLIGRVFALDLGALMAGASHKGEYEERVKAVLDEVSKSTDEGPGVILFIDEMHLLVAGQGTGSMDAANMLKPLLARGKLHCIGATTLAEYSKYIEKDAAFERRFSQVIVREPTVAETISILRGIREKYEVHHGVRILDPALIAAAELAYRYLTQRKLPDSAIDLVDECCANVKAERETRPEAIDNLERRKLELNIEIHALEREKDPASKERLAVAQKALEQVNDELRPLEAAYQNERKSAEEVNEVKKRIDVLKAKADEAERRYDIATASDIRYYAIPELEKRLEALEEQKRQDDVSGKGLIANSVTPEAIAEVVGRWTGIPVSRLMSSEAQKLLQMEKILQKQVVGQPEAVKAVANAIRLSRSGLANSARPIASFLFAGPSGTGKTLLSKTLAMVLIDSPDAMIRIDASEYSEKHAISRLIGAPPGYIGHDSGGQLTDYVRRKPFCIVLIDEIEKASREFVTLFLQVLDDGRLTDGQGRVVDFRNCVIIMTSNLGASYLNDAGDTQGHVPPRARELVMNAIRNHFPPEFINRIDDIVIFRPLTVDNIAIIVDIRLREVEQRLAPKKIKLRLDQDAKQYLASIGYSPVYGARPLNRAIQQELLNPLSMLLLEDRVKEGETCRITFDGPHNRLVIHPNHKGKQAVPPDEMDLDDAALDEADDEWIASGGRREGERT